MASSVCRRCSKVLAFARIPIRQRTHLPRSRAPYVMLSASSEPLSVPDPDGSPKTYPDKIHTIVDHISQLTLLEAAQLNELLKRTLNIPDTPMMPMGGFGAAPATQEASAEAVEEKTEFTVKLVKYAEDSKIKLIKEIRTLVEGMNLVQAKKFVEGVPQVVQEDVSKEEAERLRTALEAVGGTVEID